MVLWDKCNRGTKIVQHVRLANGLDIARSVVHQDVNTRRGLNAQISIEITEKMNARQQKYSTKY